MAKLLQKAAESFGWYVQTTYISPAMRETRCGCNRAGATAMCPCIAGCVVRILGSRGVDADIEAAAQMALQHQSARAAWRHATTEFARHFRQASLPATLR